MNTLESFRKILGDAAVISDESRLDYAKDYTKQFTPNTLAALFPQTTDQVSEILKYCSAQKIQVVPSGGRTGLCGGANALNGEVILSLQKMSKIFSIDKVNQTIHCQAGTVTKTIQIAAEEAGFYFPVDFASSGSSQIGGNVATNAGGIKVIRYGLMREWVQGLEVVLANGDVLNLKNECVKNNTGYDLKQLFVGSEGTLGVITECILKLTAPPQELQVSLFALDSIHHVTELFAAANEFKLPLSAYEFFTQEAYLRVHEHTHKNLPFAASSSHYVLVEIEKTHESDVEKFEKFVEAVSERGIILDGVIASNSQQASDFWALRENISESLSQTSVVHKNDISLPISQIDAFCIELEKTLKTNFPGVEVVLFGHIGDGNLHVNFVKPKELSKEEFFTLAHKADPKMFDLVKKYGGSISAEHGIGLTKKDFLSYTRSPAEISLMKQIKAVFDPQGLINPGKIF